MYSIALKLIITAGALLLVSEIIPGITVDNYYHALIAALVLGLLNIFIKPILVILTLPATLLTFGLFIFVINAGIFLLADFFLSGFAVDGFMPALIGSLIVSIVSTSVYTLLA
jgi:putative membrane protein